MEFTFNSPKMARFAPGRKELDAESEEDKQALRRKRRQAVQRLGAQNAQKLYTRLLELAAAANVAELIAGDPHEYGGDRKGVYSLDLARGGRLLFRSGHRETPTTPAGNIDWKKVTSVVIIHIGGHLK